MNTKESAWCAGFFDGEGCFSVHNSRGRLHGQACIAQADRRVLDRFRTAVGLGQINGPYERSGNRQHQFSYSAYGHERVQAILGFLWNDLGHLKRQQGRSVLVSVRTQGPDRRKRIGGKCVRGHDVNKPENQLRMPDGEIRCRPCSRVASREFGRKKYRLAHGIPVDAPLHPSRPRKDDDSKHHLGIALKKSRN